MNEINYPRQLPVAPASARKGEAGETALPNRGINLFPWLAHFLAVLRRRRWLILGAVVVALAASLILTLMMTPLYTARSTIEIQRENINIVRVDDVQPESSPVDMEFYQTQYGLLRSEALSERVATDLRLFDNPRFFLMYGSEAAVDWFENGRPRPGASTRAQRIRAAAEILLKNIEISPFRLSRLVEVSFTSPEPSFSAGVVDAWSRLFIETTLERRYQATSYARRFLEQRLQQLRVRLDESERRLVSYAAREGIVNIPGVQTEQGVVPERPIMADDLVALNRELTQATADRVRAGSRLQGSGGTASESLEYQAIGGLRERRAELSAEYQRMMAQFEPEYPAAVALRQQIAELDRSIGREEQRVQSSLRSAYDASSSREAQLGARVETLKSNLLDLRRRSIQYNIFQRDVDTNRQLYDALLQRYKEIGIAGGVGVNNVSVVDPARIPDRPSSPRLVINLLVALLFGLAVGFGLAFALEQIDDAISDPSDLEAAFSLPLLGTIPNSKQEDPSVVVRDRKSAVSEAYMAVQTSLSFSTDHGVPRSLAITSTRPGEGKSTTAFAVAQSLARTGRTVLLLDADMRAPSVHHMFGAQNDRGLSNFLAGDDNVASLVQKSDDANISIMSAGPQPPSAAELLSGDRMDVLLRQLMSSFDHVVVDSPPVMGLADAPLLASKTEGTIFVIESHNTRVGQARLAIGRLETAQAHLLGVLLTKFETKRASYGYGYGYEYGYGYGQNAEAKS